MFTEKTMDIIEQSKRRAASFHRERVDLESVLAIMGADAEGGIRLADCLTGGDVLALRGRCPQPGGDSMSPGKMEPEDDLRAVLESALELASGEGVPDRTNPGFIALEHLACSLAMSRKVVEMLGDGLAPLSREEAIMLLTDWTADMED